MNVDLQKLCSTLFNAYLNFTLYTVKLNKLTMGFALIKDNLYAMKLDFNSEGFFVSIDLAPKQ